MCRSIRRLSPERMHCAKILCYNSAVGPLKPRTNRQGKITSHFPPPGLALCLPHRAGLRATSRLLWRDNITNNALPFLPPGPIFVHQPRQILGALVPGGRQGINH